MFAADKYVTSHTELLYASHSAEKSTLMKSLKYVTAYMHGAKCLAGEHKNVCLCSNYGRIAYFLPSAYEIFMISAAFNK